MTDLATPPPALGLRARKKQRTEADLRTAALRLATERGFDHVTIDDIAAEVEISKTTFYRYFDSKEDALLGKSADKAEGLAAALAERPADEPTMVAVRMAMMTFVRSYEHDRDRSLAVGRLLRSTPSLQARNLEHQAAFEAVLAAFVRTRLDGTAPTDPELRARVVAAIIVATIRSTIDYWRDTEGVDHLHDVLDSALAMLAEDRTDLTAPA